MPSTKEIKRRIKSVKNTSQITKAMEVVSATKMRKSQSFALASRPYAVASLEMLSNLLERTSLSPPLLRKRTIKNSALLVVTSDKGLAGAFNANVLRTAEMWLDSKNESGQELNLITVGKKAKEYFERRRIEIQRSFSGFGDFFTLAETLPIAETVIEGYLLGAFDELDAVYTNFRTTLKQETALKKILPVTKDGVREAVNGILPEYGKYAESSIKYPVSGIKYNYEYKFEPNAEEILNTLVPQLIRMHIHHIILESNASEHSARMVAMKNATDAARDLMEELTLTYNKNRQAGITRELTEITAGSSL